MGVEISFQTALFVRLSSAGLGAALHDVAPQSADGGAAGVYPYVTFGRSVFTELDTGTTLGWDCLTRIHTFSDTGAMYQCKDIQGRIYSALHKQELTMLGFNNYSLLRVDSDCLPERDGLIHGVCEYRALIERV